MQEPSTYIQKATNAIEREKKQVEEEKEAFREFGDAVAAIDVRSTCSPLTDGDSTESPVKPITVSDGGRTQPLKQVKNLYRNTVMGTTSATEFDESTAEHMAQEFSVDVSKAVFTGATLVPQLRTALIEGAQKGRHNRQKIIERLERERIVIENAQDKFGYIADELQNSNLEGDSVLLDKMYNHHKRVTELEESCDECAVNRQQMLQATLYSDYQYQSFIRYLYRRCSFTFPVLSGLSVLGVQLRQTRTEIVDRIIAMDDGE